MRNLDEMTIGKMHPTLIFRLFRMTSDYKWYLFISRILGKRNQIVAHPLNIFWNFYFNNFITNPNQAKATVVGSRVDTQYNLVFYIRSYSNPFLMVKESKVDSKLILALTIDLLWFKSLKSSVDQKLRSPKPVRSTTNLFCIFTEFKSYWSTPRVPLTLLNSLLLSINNGTYNMAQFFQFWSNLSLNRSEIGVLIRFFI